MTLTKLIQLAQSDANTPYTTAEQQRTIIQLIAAIARQYPRHLTPYIDGTIAYAKTTVSTCDEELKNYSLQACTPLVLLGVYEFLIAFIRLSRLLCLHVQRKSQTM